MNRIVEAAVNPYEAPHCVDAPETPVSEQMDQLRKEYERRFAQLGMDAVMAAEFSTVFGMVAWKISKEPLYAGISAVVPLAFIMVEALRDFRRVV